MSCVFCGVGFVVDWAWFGWKECKDVRVLLAVCAFVEEAKNGDVAA